jgi:hypothetical protein
LGHSLSTLHRAGLVTSVGYDAYVHRIVFPLEGFADEAPSGYKIWIQCRL